LNEPLAIPVHEKKYVPALDGLRGLAIILVFTYHYFGPYFPVFSLGWSGIDLFFVLSGYLITERLLANAQRKNRYGLFYRNRVLRIMPLYYIVLVIFFGCLFLVVKEKNFHRFDYYLENAASYFLFLQNWAFIFKAKPVEPHLIHLWSLAVEEQFYLIWPCLLYTFFKARRFRTYILGAIAVIIAARVLMFFVDPHNTVAEYYYYHTFFRADSFLMGASLCFLPKSGVLVKKLTVIIAAFATLGIALGVVLLGTANFDGAFFKSIGYSLLDLLFAAALYTIITRPWGMLTRVFNLSFMRFTGKISYGIYIFHWLVLVVAGAYIAIFLKNNFTMGNQAAGISSAFICLIITYLLSFVSYKYYETWFLKRKK
jgi:peptidoglycan/LPS O-acetylase OafA/YrhL